jgi:digeranylgeranylglycerophospholipid reductase
LSKNHFDCVIVGASFAGLACATSLARRGANVVVVEKKPTAGSRLHTTGIIVKDAIDQVALLDKLPSNLVRRIDGVRLYAPNMTSVDLTAPGYYFLATDTPALMQWLATQAEFAGATILYNTVFHHAQRTRSGFDLADIGSTHYLVGADGPKSRVARELQLGLNQQHLVGVEYEFVGLEKSIENRLHCFIDKKLAPGYIGWLVPGVNSIQVGLAKRHLGHWQSDHAMHQFLEKIALIADFRGMTPSSIRAGLIPCGGVVDPVAVRRTLLIGDAAGMVSPVTAGGIHTALKHGAAAGHAIADFLHSKSDDPCFWFVRKYPRFGMKRALRWVYDNFQSDWLFNRMLSTQPMRAAASLIYFHRKGAFDSLEADHLEPGRAAKPRFDTHL